MAFFQKNSSLSQEEQIKVRQAQLKKYKRANYKELFALNFDQERAATRNCENLIGSISLPLGVAGPVSFKSKLQSGEFLIPLATSEGALVASVNRGCKALSNATSFKIISEKIGMSRAPVYALPDLKQATAFIKYLGKAETLKKIKEIAEVSSRHLHFIKLQTWQRGRFVFVRYLFDTEEAMGMNMVTIALQKIFDQFLANYSKLEMISLSSNVCVDKKASALNQIFGRGYSVQAEVFLTEEVIEKILKTSSQKLFQVHHLKNLVGSNVAGSLAQNMQAANVVAAFLLATGQDPAHTVEASQASLLLEVEEGGLRASLSMPNLNLGTVGGGTWLPAQTQARQLISRAEKPMTAQALAEVLAAAVLAAEISGLAALSTHSLAKAHQALARGQQSS